MTPERWQQIDDVLQAALLCQASERPDFLNHACANDDALRQEVESLLASHEAAGSFLVQPALEIAAESIAAQTHSMTGQYIGHYRISAALGAGGMGEVYLAEDTELGRKVALKLLPEYAMSDEARVRRFRQEARAASALSHPNIAHIYEIGEAEGAVFIALEYVAGQTLAARIAGKPLPNSEIIDIAIQAADALDEAHTCGITHRDIKSANIMLTRRGSVKVLDFGLAKIAQATLAEAPDLSSLVETGSGVVMGTVNYMSPEQALGREVDQRSDLFSLGVVLYEMSTGHLPFKGKSPTETIDRITHAQPDAIARFNYDVPTALELIIRKALRKNADERYQSASDLLNDLKSLKRELELEERLGNSGREVDYRARAHPGDQGATSAGSIIGNTSEAGVAQPTSSAEYIVREIGLHKRGAALMLAVLLVLVSGSLWAYRTWRSSRTSVAPGPWERVTQRRFTAQGGVPFRVAISPDGKSLVYRLRANGQDSLWLGQVESNSSVQISGRTDIVYDVPVFSPDGGSIYVTFRNPGRTQTRLGRMPILGGVLTELISNVDSSVTFSPDGHQLAFLRRDAERNQTSIIIADARDGRNDRVVTSHKSPENFSGEGLAWSPDGNTIAVAARTSDSSHDQILAVTVANGSESRISAHQWGYIGNLVWQPDGSGLLVSARDSLVARRSQIWFVANNPDGEARKITNDLDIYISETLSRSTSGTLAVLQGHLTSEIWIAPDGDVKQAHLALRGVEPRYEGIDGLSFLSDGRLVYSAYVGDAQPILEINDNGGGLRQLTTNGAGLVDRQMSATADGRYIVFHSNRSGSFQIWRANADGTDLKQLTTDGNNLQPSISPDSQSIIFTSERDGKSTLQRISIDGGVPTQLITTTAQWPEVSPDGKFIAYLEPANGGPFRLAIIPFGGGEAVKTFAVPDTVYLPRRMHWTPDGSAIMYRDSIQGLWRQRLGEEGPQRVKGFDDLEVAQFAWSFDGKSLAYTQGASMREIILLDDLK